MSQHIGNIIIIIKKQKTHITHLDLNKRCLLMYIYRNQMFLYKKYGPTGPCHIMVQQNRLTSLIKNGTHMFHTIKGPLRNPQLPLPQEEVVAHP
jgi:hypothetical protein